MLAAIGMNGAVLTSRRSQQFGSAPAFTDPQNTKGLAKVLTSGDKLRGRDRVKFEHVVVTRNDHSRPDPFGEFSGFRAAEIAGDLAFRPIAVDGKQRDVDRPVLEL